MTRFLRDASIIVIITLLLGEVTLRFMTSESPYNGMPMILRYALVPHRPSREVVERWLEKTKDASYVIADPELGWTIKKGGHAENRNNSTYQANPQGVRAAKDRVFAPEPPADKIRVVTVGDSFTHGDEVNNAETWEAILETVAPKLEVLNLGVPGFGTDQALLRYRRDGEPFKPKIALLGIWPENMARNLNIDRYYLDPSNGFLVKPRFVFRRGMLQVLQERVPTGGEELVRMHATPEDAPILADDLWYSTEDTEPAFWEHSRIGAFWATYRSYKRKKDMRARLYDGSDPQGLEITTAIARAFAAEARRTGAMPAILVLPADDFLKLPGFDPAAFPMTKALRAAEGLEVIDLSPALLEAGKKSGWDAVFVPSGHYSPSGNRAVAEALARELEKLSAKSP